MNPVEQTIGHSLGQQSVEKIVEQIDSYCECEKKRIESSNLPVLKAVRAEIALLLERKEQLEERIRRLAPDEDSRTRRRYALACWIL
jgi:chaperonin cofactor prefoldin